MSQEPLTLVISEIKLFISNFSVRQRLLHDKNNIELLQEWKIKNKGRSKVFTSNSEIDLCLLLRDEYNIMTVLQSQYHLMDIL